MQQQWLLAHFSSISDGKLLLTQSDSLILLKPNSLHFVLNIRATISSCNRGYGSFPFSRFLSSGALRSECLEESSNPQEKNDLRSRIFRLRLPKRSAINVIQRWVSEGNQTSLFELRQILKDLRNSQRYKHALEVCFLLSNFPIKDNYWTKFVSWPFLLFISLVGLTYYILKS